MSPLQKCSVFLVSLLLFAIIFDELVHFYRYGHLAPLALHADVVVSTRADLIGIEGIAKIYDARLTNYSIVPLTLTVCDYSSVVPHQTAVNYIAERLDRKSGKWEYVPEWDEYGSRLFCRPSFEVTETHLVRRRLWPGQTLKIGEIIPAERTGYRVGNDGRFTIFLDADGKGNAAISTVPFHVDQQLKGQVAPINSPLEAK